MLEPEVSFLPKIMRRVRFAHQDDILDADAELPVRVVAGFYEQPNTPPSRRLVVVLWEVKEQGREGKGRDDAPFETVMPGFKGLLLYAIKSSHPQHPSGSRTCPAITAIKKYAPTDAHANPMGAYTPAYHRQFSEFHHTAPQQSRAACRKHCSL